MRKLLLSFPGRALVLCLFLLGRCAVAEAQAVGEAAATSSVAGGVSAQAGTVVVPPTKAAAAATVPSSSPHLAASSGPPPEVVNRQALEGRAGKNACKLLMRSTPTGAQVWIDGEFVGNTPLLLLVPPGKYQIQMKGQRLEYAKQVVSLLPRETQEVALTLAVRYPLRITVH
jgi:PEGA domain-containing protein